jgi:hypothetical protein
MEPQPAQQIVTLSLTQEFMSIYPLCAHIDIRLKKLKKKAIFIVGLSRTGKSTIFNHVNNVPLFGVPSEVD